MDLHLGVAYVQILSTVSPSPVKPSILRRHCRKGRLLTRAVTLSRGALSTTTTPTTHGWEHLPWILITDPDHGTGGGMRGFSKLVVPQFQLLWFPVMITLESWVYIWEQEISRYSSFLLKAIFLGLNLGYLRQYRINRKWMEINNIWIMSMKKIQQKNSKCELKCICVCVCVCVCVYWCHW